MSTVSGALFVACGQDEAVHVSALTWGSLLKKTTLVCFKDAAQWFPRNLDHTCNVGTGFCWARPEGIISLLFFWDRRRKGEPLGASLEGRVLGVQRRAAVVWGEDRTWVAFARLVEGMPCRLTWAARSRVITEDSEIQALNEY